MHIWPGHALSLLVNLLYLYKVFLKCNSKLCITGILLWDTQESQAVKNFLGQQFLQEPASLFFLFTAVTYNKEEYFGGFKKIFVLMALPFFCSSTFFPSHFCHQRPWVGHMAMPALSALLAFCRHRFGMEGTLNLIKFQPAATVRSTFQASSKLA